MIVVFSMQTVDRLHGQVWIHFIYTVLVLGGCGRVVKGV